MPRGQRLCLAPVKLSDFKEESFASPPLLGQHTAAVLTELLGMDEAEIAGLRAQKVIA